MFFIKKSTEIDKYSTFNLVKRIFKEYILPNRYKFALSVIFMLLASSSVAYRAYLMKPAIDKIFVNRDISQLFMIAGQVLGIGIVLCFTNYLNGLILQGTNLKISTDLQERLFNSIIVKDIDYFKNRSPGKIMSYFGDISGLMTIMDIVLNNLILQMFTLISLVVLMLYQNFKLTLASFAGFLLIIKPLLSIARKIKKSTGKSKETATVFSALTCESFENIEIIKSNGTEELEKNKIKNTLDNLYDIGMRIIKRSMLTAPIMEFISSVGFATVLLYGGYSVINGSTTAGSFFTFLTAMLSAYKPAKSFGGLNIKMQTALISAKRLYQIIDDKPKIIENDNCDCIFVFENGKLVEYGDNDTLLNNNSVYKNLYDKQFGGKIKLKND